MSDEFDAAVAATLQPEPAQAARIGFSAASDTDPDAYAEAQRVARRTGVPVATALNLPREMKRQDAIGTIDFDTLAKTSPATASLLADVEKARIAHDDVENMGLVETLLNSFKRGVPALRSLIPSLHVVNQSAGLNLYRQIDDRIAGGEDPKKVLADYGDYGLAPMPWHTSEQALASWQSWKANAVPNMQGNVGAAAADVARLQGERNAIPLPGVVDRTMAEKTWGGAFSQIASDPLRFIAAIGPESLVQTAPGLVAAVPAGIVGGPGGVAATVGGNSFLVDYASTLVEAMQSAGIDTTNPDAIREGLKDPETLAAIAKQGARHASVVGALDALSGGIAGRMVLPQRIAGKLATRPLAQELANIAAQVPIQGALGGAGELGGEIYAGQEVSPGNVLAEVFGEVFGTPAEVTFASVKRIHARIGEARQADQSAQALANLNELAAASKVLRRAPATFERFIAQATEDGPVQHVFIDAQTLMQSGVAEQIAAVAPSVAEQMPAALANGGQIAIPVEEYAARVAPTEYAQPLLDHLKTDPEGFSRAEAQEYMQSGAAEELKTEFERVLTEKAGEDTWNRSAQDVEDAVFGQLQQAGRFTADVNRADAALHKAFASVMAAKLGTTPMDFFNQHTLRVVAERMTGGQFDQALPGALPKGWIKGDGATVAEMWRGEKSPTAVLLGQVAGKLRDAIPGAEAYSHSVGTSAMQHIRSQHGSAAVENARGQLPVTEKDVALIPEIVAHYDAMRSDLQSRRGNPIIAYAMRVDDGVILYLEEVRKKRRDMAALSMWKYPAEADVQRVLDSAVSGPNVRNGGGHALSLAPGDESFNQEPGDRGAFNPDTNTIALLKNADLSTFLHESGHFFLEVMVNVAAQPDAPAEIQKDARVLLQWFGVPDLPAWDALTLGEKRSYHEQFARGFESYLFEGNAPSVELQGMFQRFRAWLLNVYRSLKALNVELTDEVRGVFDRMLATNEQILLAEQARGMMPLFATAEAAGMTPEEFAAYQSLGFVATQDAVQQLQARSLRDMQWLANAKGRELKRLQQEAAAKRKEVLQEVTAEVDAQPVYRAMHWLKRGETIGPDGEAIKAEKGYKLDIEALRQMYPETSLARPDIDALGKGRYGMAGKEGLHPDLVAEMFGFTSGDALVRTLIDAAPRSDVIEGMTDQRMLERYGDLTDPQALERAAEEAIHNEARARFVATELNALAKATGQRSVLVAAAKEYAAATVARLKLRDLRPAQYTAAEARAAGAADKAVKGGDLATAAVEKRNQLINVYATKAAYAAQEEVRTTVAWFKKISSGKDDVIAKTRDMDMVQAVRAILAEYGIGAKGKKAADYLKTVEANDPAMYAVLRDRVEAAVANAKPLADLTVEELRGLNDEVESLWYLARRSRQMEVDGDLLDRQDVQDSLRARLEEIGIPDTVPGEGRAITEAEGRLSMLQSFLAAARRVESWVGVKDGSSPMGPFRRYVWNTIKEPANAYRTDKAKYLKRFRELLAPIAPTLTPVKIAAPELGYTFGYDKGGMGKVELLHALLHTGNESNKRKLLLGRKWAIENADGTLDTSRWEAFVARMIVEGRITRADYDFAQGVWDLMEDMTPLAQKAHRDVFGRYFDEVAANAFDTPFGRYRGGYVPAIADPRVVTDAKTRALAEEENSTLAFAFPATSKGFTKGRVEGYTRPLLLDLRNLTQHIDKVLLFSHLEQPIRDVRRVLTSKPVAYALNRIDPAAFDGLLTPWLNRTARQQVETAVPGSNGLMRFFSVARSRAGMAAMFGNLANAAQQVTGLSIAALKVKPKHLMAASVEFIRAPRHVAETVAAISPYMATRMDNEIEQMHGAINDVLLNPSTYDNVKNWTTRHAYFMQAAVDNVVGPIVWLGAYNQALESGMTEKEARQLGDSAVRETQGSTLPEDISRIETGNAFVRMFTQFAGYFNMQANVLGTEFAKLAQDTGLRKGAGKGFYILLLGFLVPAWTAEAIMQGFRGGPDDEDKDGEYLDDWLAAVFGWATLRNATAMVPGIGQTINAFANTFNKKPYDDRISTAPAISMIESAVQAPHSVYKAIVEGGKPSKAVRDLATLLSMSVGVPVNVLAKPVGYVADVDAGRVHPTSAADAVRGAVTGAASPESKR